MLMLASPPYCTCILTELHIATSNHNYDALPDPNFVGVVANYRFMAIGLWLHRQMRQMRQMRQAGQWYCTTFLK